MTRRALAGALAAPVLLGTRAEGQAPVEVPRDPALAVARSQFQNGARQLAGVKLARNVEPASRFEA